MLSELPKLFGRSFAVGYFLPAIIGAIAFISVDAALGDGRTSNWLKSVDGILDLTVGLAIVWLLAVLLMALNRLIHRAYEGYLLPHKWIRDWLLARIRKRHEALRSELQLLDEKYDDLTQAQHSRRAKLSQRLAQEYPEEIHLLPTRFGNVIRAFETYPRIMYGLDDIPGWLRLLGVLPETYRVLIEDLKAMTDFWLNLRLITLLIAVLAIVFLVRGYGSPLLVPAIIVVWTLFDLLLSYASRDAAIQWGETVKAAYDVYLPKLREEMRLSEPTDADDEFRQWQSFSRAVIYRRRDQLPPRRLSTEPAASTKRRRSTS
ncbi:MAG: hypothetical protein WD397_08235 [Wenzhouxiangellaceae bacterium]